MTKKDDDNNVWFARLINWLRSFCCWSTIFKRFNVENDSNQDHNQTNTVKQNSDLQSLDDTSDKNISDPSSITTNNLNQSNIIEKQSDLQSSSSTNINPPILSPATIDDDNLSNKEKFAKNLSKSKQINSLDKLGWTPLHQACINGNFELVQALLKYGADINAQTLSSKQTPIIFAVNCAIDSINEEQRFQKYFRLVKILLEKGANPNISTKGGDTSLSIICGEGRKTDNKNLIELAKLLIDNSKLLGELNEHHKIKYLLLNINNRVNNQLTLEFIEQNLPDCEVQYITDVKEIEGIYEVNMSIRN